MAAALLVLLALLGAGQSPERIATIQIHGNVLTAEADILKLAAVAVGDAFDASTLEQITLRLRAADRFESVEVLKRYASIADPSQIALVLIVHEGPVTIDFEPKDGQPPVRKRRGPTLMVAPVLRFEDGYGFTYGARTAWPGLAGERSRLSVPLTWGGDKRAGVDFEKTLPSPLSSRLLASFAVNRRENPFFEADDDRIALHARVERDVGAAVRVGATAETAAITFLEDDTRMDRIGADVIVDTRRDPMLARNAVFGRAAWDHLTFHDADSAQRIDLEARGYLGMPFGTTLVARVRRQDSDRRLPDFERPLFGGVATVRGFALGDDIGDSLLSTSAELRVPLTSPLRVGQFGLSAFIDAGAVYDKGERLTDQVFKRGVGGGVWMAATVFRLSVSVAHGVGGSTRAHLETTLLF